MPTALSVPAQIAYENRLENGSVVHGATALALWLDLAPLIRRRAKNAHAKTCSENQRFLEINDTHKKRGQGVPQSKSNHERTLPPLSVRLGQIIAADRYFIMVDSARIASAGPPRIHNQITISIFQSSFVTASIMSVTQSASESEKFKIESSTRDKSTLEQNARDAQTTLTRSVPKNAPCWQTPIR